LRFNHPNPEQKNENFILADAFFKDLSNAYNNSKKLGLPSFSMLATLYPGAVE